MLGIYELGLDSRNRVSSFRWTSLVNQNDQILKNAEEYAKRNFVTFDTVEAKRTTQIYTQYQVLMNAAVPSYISVPYDPYPAVRWGIENSLVREWHNFDLKAEIGQDQFDSMWNAFGMIPRGEFEIMALEVMGTATSDLLYRNKTGKEIMALIPSSSMRKFHWFMFRELPTFLMGSHLIDIFNRANLEQMQRAKVVDPMQWERQKTVAFATKDFDDEVLEIHSRLQVNDPILSPIYRDELRKKELEKRLSNLFKTGDPMFNVQRDAAIAGLIAQKEFDVASAMLAVNEALPREMVDGLKNLKMGE